MPADRFDACKPAGTERKGGNVASVTRKRRILVVEDEPDTRTFLRTLLTSGGFDTVASDGSGAVIGTAKDLRPDLILLDIMLANERGIQIYRNLKSDKRLGRIPVIILSAIDRETFFHYQRFQNVFPGSGIPRPDAYLEKPPEADELLRLARRLTSKADVGQLPEKQGDRRRTPCAVRGKTPRMQGP